MPRRLDVAIYAALLALVAWSAWQRYTLLAASPFPVGVDGYFYPVQLRELLATGSLRYPASPLAFYAMAPLAWLTDPITGAKLGAAIGGAAIAIPIYGLGARLGGRGAGLLAAAIATTSAGSAYLTLEFVKNGIGLAVATLALWAVVAAIEVRPLSIRRAALAGIAIVAAALTHKMAAGLVLAVATPALAVEAYARGALRKQTAVAAVAAVALAVTAIVAAGALAPRRFLSAGDAVEVASLVSSTPRWDMPALVQPHLAMGYEPLLGAIAGALALAALIASRRRRSSSSARWPQLAMAPGTRVAAIALAVLALAIGLPWLAVDDAQGLGMRLRVAAFVPLALCAAIAARAALSALSDRARDAILAATAAAVVIAVTAAHPAGRTDGEIVVHPALASAVMSLDGLVPAGATVVVPERHIAFMVAWYAHADVAIRPDEIDHDHRVRLLPLAFTGDGSSLDRALGDARHEPLIDPPLGLHARHPNGLVLVTEGTWDWLMTRLSGRDRAYFSAWPTI